MLGDLQICWKIDKLVGELTIGFEFVGWIFSRSCDHDHTLSLIPISAIQINIVGEMNANKEILGVYTMS